MPPPLRLLRLANPVVRRVLSSPAHRLLSGSLVLLEVERGDGCVRIPLLGAERSDGSVVVLAVAPDRKRWWRSFRRSSSATLVVRREVRPMEGALVEQPAARRDALRAYLARFPRTARALALPPQPADDALDALDAAVVRFVPIALAESD